MKKSFALLAAALGLSLVPAKAAMVITEWMYNGSEFVEFTNTGSTAVDMTGWGFSDNTRGSAGYVDLSTFGVVAAGQSVILSEVTADAFRTLWGPLAGVKIIGENSQNLGRGDEINLYDAARNLVDRLTFGDNVAGVGGIRTDGDLARPGSGVTNPANYGANTVTTWTFSALGDGVSFQSAGTLGTTTPYNLIGSPGVAVIPEASTLLFSLAGGLGLLRRRR